MVPADFDTADNQARSGPLLGESIVNVVTSVIADGKTAILVEPRKTTLNNPPINPKTTAVICTPLSQNWLDAPLAKFLAVWLAVVSSITQHRSGTPKRLSNYGEPLFLIRCSTPIRLLVSEEAGINHSLAPCLRSSSAIPVWPLFLRVTKGCDRVCFLH
jgi:hypothetical protein